MSSCIWLQKCKRLCGKRSVATTISDEKLILHFQVFALKINALY